VEPFALPEPDARPTVCPDAERAAEVCGRSVEADLHLLRQAALGVRPDALRAPDDNDDRTRYRWMVGHHGAFAAWRCLRDALRAAVDGTGPPDQAVRTAARMYDVYSVLFLYTGSCSAERYEATVRPEMMSRDPAFSGQWQRDYEGIPELVKRVRAMRSRRIAAPLTQAARLNHRVHMAVAKKLVPEGESLLKQAGGKTGASPSQAQRDLCDDYFAVRRQPVCEYTFAAQFIRRLAQVLCDISAHGLTDPDAPTPGFGPPHTGSVEAFEYKPATLLRGVAENIAGQAAFLPERTTAPPQAGLGHIPG
jgi:hypothetical protein